jgi:hypothetical protein
MTPAINLLLVTAILAIIYHRYQQLQPKFIAGNKNTGKLVSGKVSLNSLKKYKRTSYLKKIVHLSAMSLAPVTNLYCQISHQIFVKILKWPSRIPRARGKLIYEKT